MAQALLWGGFLRLAQALVQAGPTIIVGMLVAGIFHRLLGYSGVRRLFAAGTRWELPRAWLIGMLLPVCSLGVIPVAREMRRAGIAGGTVLAFAMTAPLFNPLSILYGLTLSEPFVIFAFAVNALVVVTVVGGVWDKLFPNTALAEPEPPAPEYGVKRMTSIFVYAAREAAGPSLNYVAIALLGVAALSFALPPGSLMTTMEHDNPFAPLQMTGVAIPAYATPMIAMSQLGSMFQHANSAGSAFVLLTLGAGLNLGLVVWMYRSYGVRRASIWFAILLGVVIGLAYIVETPLHPAGISPPGHTHAFDIYCRPYDSGATGLPGAVFATLKENSAPYERVALIVLGSLTSLGVALNVLDRRRRIEEWIERKRERSTSNRLDVIVSAQTLGVVALLGLTVLSLVGCFAYYPSPAEVFDEMYILRGEVLSAAVSGNQKHALHFIPVWDDWTRRLQVGSFLREGKLTPYRRMKAKVFRDRLELLKHAVEEGDREETQEYVRTADAAYRRMRQTFLDRAS